MGSGVAQGGGSGEAEGAGEGGAVEPQELVAIGGGSRVLLRQLTSFVLDRVAVFFKPGGGLGSVVDL